MWRPADVSTSTIQGKRSNVAFFPRMMAGVAVASRCLHRRDEGLSAATGSGVPWGVGLIAAGSSHTNTQGTPAVQPQLPPLAAAAAGEVRAGGAGRPAGRPRVASSATYAPVWSGCGQGCPQEEQQQRGTPHGEAALCAGLCSGLRGASIEALGSALLVNERVRGRAALCREREKWPRRPSSDTASGPRWACAGAMEACKACTEAQERSPTQSS